MAERRFPRPDAEFSVWMANYFVAVTTFYEEHGLAQAPLVDLADALDAWNAAYPAHVTARNAAESARRTKDAARRTLESRARGVTAFIQSFPQTTDADRATIGITIREKGPRAVPPPSSPPVAVVDAGERLTHTLRLFDAATPTRRSRPRGAERAEVFVAFTPAGTPPPTSLSAYRYVQSVSDGATTLSFDVKDGGLQAHYLARWVTRGGAAGPWSETASATVAA